MNLHPRAGAAHIVAGLLALFLLFYLRPYYGIRHDAALYLGQALLRLDPANFESDLFFAFGSQANFTVFPDLLARLLAFVNAAEAFVALTVIGLLLFLVASAVLLSRLYPHPLWYFGLLSLLIFPASYGGRGVFAYSEAFFSGRSLAEPLVLFAIVAYLKGRRGIAGGIWLMGALLHPLQALPALLLWWCDQVRVNRHWLHLLWMPVAALLAGAVNLLPDNKWMAPYDPQWLSWSKDHAPHVFLTLWEWPDWAFLSADVFLVCLVAIRASNPLRQVARSMLAATLLGFSASLILVDGLNLILPTGLQMWRTHWLLHWLAIASIPYLLHWHYSREGWRSLRGWMVLTIAVLGARTLSTGPGALIVWLLIPLYFTWPRLAPQVSPSVRNMLLFALPTALVILLFKQGVAVNSKFVQSGSVREMLRPEFAVLSHPLASGGLTVLAIAIHYFRVRWRPVLLVLLVPMMAHAFAQWDRRSTWTQYVEAAEYAPRLFGRELEPGAHVYWDKELVAPWLILHRPSYFTSQQMSGALFNRKTAEEGAKRFENIALLEFQLMACRLMNDLNKSEDSCLIDKEVIAEVCQKSEGTLDYLVLDTKVTTSAAGSWTIKRGLKTDRPITYYLYPCRTIVDTSKNG